MKKKRALSMILCTGLLAASLLTGCSSQTVSEETTENATTSTDVDTANNPEDSAGDSNEEKMKISIAIWDIGTAVNPDKQDAVLEKLENDFNIEIEPVAVTWNDFSEKFQIWSATNELPDIVAHSQSLKDVWKWKDQGVIRAIPDDLSAYPNLSKYLEDERSNVFVQDGKRWAIPRLQFSDDKYAYGKTIFVWKDIYDSLGLEKKPETYDELKEMFLKIKEQYPDMVPLTSQNLGYMFFLVMNENPYMMDGYGKFESGKWENGFFQESTVDALEKMRELWSLGIIDKDWPINKDTTNGGDKFAEKRAAAVVTTPYPTHIYYTFGTTWEKMHPDEDLGENLEMINMPSSSDGKWYFNSGTFYSESYFSANVDDAKMERILQLYDYLLSEDGINLMRYGIEGVDFVKSGDEIEITREKDESGNFVALTTKYPSVGSLRPLVFWDEDFPFVDPTIKESIRRFGEEYMEWKQSNTEEYPGHNPWISTISSPLKDNFQTDILNDCVKIVIAEGDVRSEWQKTVDEYMNLGYEEMIEEFNAVAAEAGY